MSDIPPESVLLKQSNTPGSLFQHCAALRTVYQTGRTDSCVTACARQWQPFTNIEVGMPDDLISPDVCARMGIPAGARWGPNAGEIRQVQMQQMQMQMQFNAQQMQFNAQQ